MSLIIGWDVVIVQAINMAYFVALKDGQVDYSFYIPVFLGGAAVVLLQSWILMVVGVWLSEKLYRIRVKM